MAFSLSSSLHPENSSYQLINGGTSPRWTDPANSLSPAAHYTIGVYLTVLGSDVRRSVQSKMATISTHITPFRHGITRLQRSLEDIAITATLGVVATLGNGAVLVLMQWTPVFRRKVQNMLLMALAWSDLVLSVLGYPMTAASSFSLSWIFGDVMCRLHGFLVFMMSMVSMNTLVLIAIFRYIVICHPAYDSRVTVQTVRWSLLVAWVHAAVWTSLPLLGWSSYTYETVGTACTINWLGTSFSDRSYIMATMLTCYVMQVSVISFCYLNIMRVARRLTFGWRPKTDPLQSMYRVNEALWVKKIKAERAVTLICLIMIVAYLVLWTPYAAISLLSMAFPIPLWLTTLPTMFAKMACAANPIIYCLLSRRFRRKMRRPNLTQKTHMVHSQIHTPSKSFALNRVILHSLPERELVTKDGIYIGKNTALFVAEGTLF